MNRIALMTAGCLLLLAIIPAAALSADSASARPTDSAAIVAKDTATADSIVLQPNRVIVYYFHGNRRCPTCRALEGYSDEAIEKEFAAEIKNGTVEWQVLNYEDEENEHFVKTYGLYVQSLILSRVVSGKEVAWKDLDKIWELVKDKDKFLAYVHAETRAFINEKQK